MPHYQKVKDDILDGMRLFEDITYADSMGRSFFALPDFAYVISTAEEDVVFGECYRIRDGILENLTCTGETRNITNLK